MNHEEEQLGVRLDVHDLEIGGVIGENWPRWATWVCQTITLAIILLGLSIILKCVGW